MPRTISRKRRATLEEEEESEDARPGPSTQRRKNRGPPPSDNDDEEEDDDDASAMDVDNGPGSHEQVVKKLVRYALACEFARVPITRIGMREKVFGKQGIPFKKTFEAAQEALRSAFGMEMEMLSTKENVSVKARLKDAAKKNGGAKAAVSSSYTLRTLLPIEYRTPTIIPPSKAVSTYEEATYTGLYTAIISIIALSSNGTMSDSKLMNLLGRLNAEKWMLGQKTELILKKMEKQNYIVKLVEKNPDEETISWRVGPRGKAEIGNTSIMGLVEEVYGEHAPEDLQKRLERSLGMSIANVSQAEEEGADEEPQTNGRKKAKKSAGRGRPRRSQTAEEEESQEEDDDE